MSTRYVPKTIHTANMPYREPALPEAPPVQPFVTIAQQAGAESPALARRLTEMLSAREPRSSASSSSSPAAWSHWDQELIEKVSADSQIPADLISSLETSGHSWIDDLLAGVFQRPDDLVIFHRVKDCIRDLARAGHVVLVGHGSVFMTCDLPGGVHIRLIAPLRVRARNVAARFGLSYDQALRKMRRIDRQRRTFFRRFWPNQPLSPQIFSAVLNTALLDEDRLLRAIAAMLPPPPQASGR
ncbi:MAG TPA: cytidylate kinase family protein [Tepidisphaeraceae bacterium]|nr:cytidylate kinase family protein [Tepidisphaeraceae bacterium]